VPDAIVRLLVTAIQLYSLVLVARIILSWIPSINRSQPIVFFLYQITEPVLDPVRRVIPPLGMIDISPIVVFIGLRILQRILLSSVADV
jgi:YggT family protein